MSSLPPIVIIPNPSMTPTDYSSIYNNALNMGYAPQQVAPIVSAAMLGQGFTQAQIGDAISMPGSTSSSQTLSTEPGAASAAPSSFWSNPFVAGAMAGLGVASPTASAGVQAAQAAKSVKLSGPLAWIESRIGNYGLVAFGAILALGALLISQKGTIVKVTSTAAKAGALLG